MITVADVTEAAARETKVMIGDVAPGCKVRVCACDVSDAEQLERCFADHLADCDGALDICFNNAGVEERPDIPWRKVVAINTDAVIHGTMLAIDAMQRRGGAGVIVNVASAGGIFPMPRAPVYAATKAAVVNYTRSLAHLGRKNIRVCALCPQYTATPLVSRSMAQLGDKAAGKEMATVGRTWRLLYHPRVVRGVFDSRSTRGCLN